MPAIEGLRIDAVELTHDARQIGFEDFHYKMKGRWGIERCLISRPAHDPIEVQG